MSEDCVFCNIVTKKISAKIVYEDDKSISFLDAWPTANGHALVIPKIHVSDLSHCPDDYLAHVIQNAKKTAEKLMDVKSLSPWGFNFLSNQGSVAGQEVMHFHLHVIPKYARGEGFGFAVNKTNLLPIDDVWEMIQKK